MSESVFQFGKHCIQCETEDISDRRLQDTGETFDGVPYQVYRCPSCGQTYKVQRAYHISPKEKTVDQND